MTTVLVVDDESDLLACIEGLLEDEGYTVVTFPDGKQALDYLRGGARPDLALVDLMMPIMNGFDLVAAVSKERQLDGMPIVIMSAVEQRQELLQKLDGRAQAVLKKPFTADKLLGVVGKVLAAPAPAA
ncbi:chemotaxis protein CheY [Sorangium cellulosum]|uniref:Chemotaxis protein CheY n=1 Tax=Sorangium cellulosum TaxID=56 RepID=A0A2L0F8N4_SORCE|nr:response regulator [Sorangium cellulosum]AUX47958.1 chemotaxis protein CheY [Sorangium cellulosum]